jgi:4-amino-4-deoxy-L-arabinose transferase-like glycosyltransferase
VALASILLVATVLRFVALDRVPPGPSYDELQNARLSARVLEGEWALYFAENFGQEPLYPTLAALTVRLFGWNMVALRIPAALAGLLSVLVVYLVGRRLDTERVGLLAAAFQAVSFWPLLETRVALEISLLPLLSATAMLFLARALDEEMQNPWHTALNFGLAGVLLGGHVYAYTAGRAMPFLPIALLLYLALFVPDQIRRKGLALLVLVVVTALVVTPLAVFLHTHPDAEQRLEQLSGTLELLRQGDPRRVLEITVGTLGMFTFRGEPQWLYNVAERPVFDPLASILFYIGLAWCVFQLRDWRCGLTLLCLMVGLSPGMVSPPAGSFTHTLAAQPAVYVVLGLGGDAAWRRLSQRRARLGPALVAAAIALSLVLSCHAYFDVWRTAPQVSQLYQGGVTAVAKELNAHTPPGPVAIGAPYVNYWHPWNAIAFDLSLRRKDLDVRWFNPAESVVWPVSSEPVTFYFPYNPLGPQSFAPELEKLFLSDASQVPSPGNDFVSFRVTDLTGLERRLASMHDMFLAWPPGVSHSRAPTLPVVFGDRFALTGAEIGQKAVASGAELRLITYWETMTADPTSVVAFAHLTSDGKDIWGQHDGLEVRCASLRPGDRFAQTHRIPVKAETPSGTYYVQIGLYAPDTLIRLPVTTARGSAVDRVWVQQVEVTEE